MILYDDINLMLNSKRSFNNNEYNGSKSRSKSIYRGDHSHTISMHLRTATQISPDKIRAIPDLELRHKYSYNQSKIQQFRQLIKIPQPKTQSKYTQRNQSSKSNKKIISSIAQTQRVLKQLTNNNTIYHKNSDKYQRVQQNRDKIINSSCKSMDKIPINHEQLKNILIVMKKMQEQNRVLKKQLNIMKNIKQVKNNSTIIKALLQ